MIELNPANTEMAIRFLLFQRLAISMQPVYFLPDNLML
jgi:hypothetical protein